MPRPQSAGRRRRPRPKQQAPRPGFDDGGFGDEWGAGPEPAASPSRAVSGRRSRGGHRGRDNPAAAEGKQQVVTLDGVAIPLVDPQNFQEFWREREEQRQREPRPVYAAATASEARLSGSPLSGSGKDPDRNASSPVGFYTANKQRQQGALTVYGEATPTRDTSNAHSGGDGEGGRVGVSPRGGGGRKHGPARSSPQKAFRRKQRERPKSAQHSGTRLSSRGRGRNQRPQSAQPAKRRRPKSSSRMASTAGGAAARGYGVHSHGGDPAMVMVTGSEADRRRVIEGYAKSIKEQRRVRPTTSSEYLKLRAARRRAAAKDFADSLAEEEKRRKAEVRAQVIEANKWSIMLSTEHSFSVVEDPSAGVHELAVHVMSTGERGNVLRKLSVAAFQREYEKMKFEVDRKKALRALSASASAGGAFDGADAGDDAGNARPSRGRSRRAVQSELKSILRDTERLTDTLVRQLRELKACGWNSGYL